MDWLTSIRDIKKAQDNNQLVIFVGAGVSRNSNVPTWWELIKKIADEIGYDKCITCSCRDKGKSCPDENCKNRYAFTQEEFLRIPEYYYQQHKSPDDDAYYNLIYKTLSGGTGSNAIDDEIVNLLPHHIITTNYDSLLEDSTSINSSLYAVVSQDSDMLSKTSSRYIIKMHGDLKTKDSIVLKESDYIDYEQKHPLISTFIRSLLVNHTFVFLGYSLNDYNLNLIIGWINYFCKIHGVKKRPSNYLISSKAATELERSRLEDKNIYVIDISTLPTDIEHTFVAPESITDSTGRKLFSYLKCISSSEIMQKYIPLEEQLIEKYEALKSYSKISYQDLIGIYPFGRTVFLDTELFFYEKEWYEKISELLDNPDSVVAEVFRRAGISAICLYGDDSVKAVPNAFEPIDDVFQLYIDNDYIELENVLQTNSNTIQKLYYYHLLCKDKETLEVLLGEITNKHPATNHVEILLQNTRERCAFLSILDPQKEKTQELRKIFETAPEKWSKVTSFLRMLFESAGKNMYAMEKLLQKLEKRYEYHSSTFYSEHAHVSLWELKAFAYDYYFFFIENGLPLHYFSNPKEYFSYYLRAILCTYSPIGSNSHNLLARISSKQPRYILNEIDLDIMVKYTNPKDLTAWLKKYSVQEIEIEDNIDVVKKFSNYCKSVEHYQIRYWINHLHCFVILLCLIKTNNESKKNILASFCNLLESAVFSNPRTIDESLNVLKHLILYLRVEGAEDVYKRIIEVIVSSDVLPILLQHHSDAVDSILKHTVEYMDHTTGARLMKETNEIDDPKEKLKKIYALRYVLPKDYCKGMLNANIDSFSSEKIFFMLLDGFLDFNDCCWKKFINTIQSQDLQRKEKPGVRTYPDWLIITIEHSMILKLLGFDVNLDSLAQYAHYSNQLQFMLDPENFDYSLVDTSDNMWQNLIYSTEYRHYFVNHKEHLLSGELKNLFALGVETTDQRKIVYGLLLEKDNLRDF